MARIKQRKRKARMVQVHNRRRKPVVMVAVTELEQLRVKLLTELFALPADLMVEERRYARYS